MSPRPHPRSLERPPGSRVCSETSLVSSQAGPLVKSLQQSNELCLCRQSNSVLDILEEP